MKLIHTSDMHLDSPLSSRLSPDKIKERKTELLNTLARLAEEAVRIGAEAIIIAGDLFDGAITRRAASFVRELILKYKEIKFFILDGNHDAGMSEAIELSGIENVFLFSEQGCTFLLGNEVTVSGGASSDALLNSLSLPEDKANIVVLHGELRSSGHGEHIINSVSASGKNIDYLALGHYHSYSAERIDKRCTAVYSGTPEGRGFDEAAECGYVLVEAGRDGVKHSFVPFAKRRLHWVRLDISSLESAREIREAAERALLPIHRGDLVRLELIGGFLSGLDKDTDMLLSLWKDKFYFFELKDSSRISVRPEDYKNDKSLKGEFIRLVYSDGSMTDEEKDRVAECGIRALYESK